MIPLGGDVDEKPCVNSHNSISWYKLAVLASEPVKSSRKG
jgi:hypothetical protein